MSGAVALVRPPAGWLPDGREFSAEFHRLRANPGRVAAVLAALSAGAAGGGIAYRKSHKPSRTQAVLRAVKLSRRKKKKSRLRPGR